MNGDVNGNSVIDLSDAVFLLNWLFLGGPPPVPCCENGTGLPDTGQTKTYGECFGQDGHYSTGCPSEGRYIDNGDRTVTDTCTGLMWQQGTPEFSLPWCDALVYCQDLQLAGHTDWRMPNVRELQSIVNYGRFDPASHPVFGAVPSLYWSSTSLDSRTDVQWSVDFLGGGIANDIGIDVDIFVRAVRSIVIWPPGM